MPRQVGVRTNLSKGTVLSGIESAYDPHTGEPTAVGIVLDNVAELVRRLKAGQTEFFVSVKTGQWWPINGVDKFEQHPSLANHYWAKCPWGFPAFGTLSLCVKINGEFARGQVGGPGAEENVPRMVIIYAAEGHRCQPGNLSTILPHYVIEFEPGVQQMVELKMVPNKEIPKLNFDQMTWEYKREGNFHRNPDPRRRKDLPQWQR